MKPSKCLNFAAFNFTKKGKENGTTPLGAVISRMDRRGEESRVLIWFGVNSAAQGRHLFVRVYTGTLHFMSS